MTKLAIVLCIAIFASATNGLSVTEQLESAQKSVLSLIDNTIERIKSMVANAKAESAELAAQIEAQANEFKQRIANDVNARLTKAKGEVKKLTDEVHDVDVSECSELGEYLQSTAQAAILQMKKCFLDKRTTAAGYIENMVTVADGVLKNLNVLKLEARACIENVDSIISAGKALWCTNVVAAKAAWTTAKAVPSLSLEIGKLTFLLTTLPPTLTYCTTTSALATFYYEVSGITSRTSKCIQQKIGEVRNNFSKSTAKPVESTPEPTTPEYAPTEGESATSPTEHAPGEETSAPIEEQTAPAEEKSAPADEPAAPGTSGDYFEAFQ